jgi:tRNA(Ile)-lysidine synthase
VAAEEVLAAVRRALHPLDAGLIVMLSGGRDSVCLLHASVQVCGADAVTALHVDYGLREQSATDARHCAEVCRALRVELDSLQAGGAGREREGNLQAWAREIRYEAAERLAERDGALYATGHTADDQAETILYRLAASPGRRALQGMNAREGRLVRPLLTVTRAQTEAYCREAGLGWRDDASNEDARFARTRVRAALLPALAAVHPAARENVVRTAALLREETELLDALVAQTLQGRQEIPVSVLRELPAALARLVVIALAERAAGTYVPQAGERVAEILALAARGGRSELHVGGCAGAVVEGGMLSMVRLPPRTGGGGAAASRSAPPGD